MAHPDAADGIKASPKLEPDAPPDGAQDAMEVDSAEEQAVREQELRENGAQGPDGQDDAVVLRQQDDAQQRVQQIAAQGAPKVSSELYEAMAGMLEALYDYRDENGDDPSRIFHKRPNRRNYREYYDIIKEPMAMSVIKAKINTQTYVDFREFVRDCALIWHNAMVYNKPISEAYQHSQILKGVMAAELRKIVDQGTVPAEEAEWPDLGPIPPVDEDEDEGDDDENADGEEDSDDDNDGDDDGRDNSEADKPRRRGRRPSGLKRINTDNQQEASNKRRGRPPKVDTPLESRMKNVLKAIRRPRYKNDSPMIIDFEKLPDRNEFPDYFTTIARPICLEQIKRFMKRKRYATVNDMVADLDVMFDNALQYNEENSEIWRGAQHLKALAHTVAVEETAKPDSAFSHEEGRKPKPGGIMYKGQLWKVGDWVHIQNPNTASRPIVAQIYRTWQEEDGRDWINACWYYRPEQTVHHFEKHFWPNEVLKTSQYRDHPIEQVIDQCFVMFFTRFNKGRPKGLPAGTEVYVCEARYNEEKHRINKIKTWSSCLPDEVRDQNYEMEPFEVPRRIKKLPSPLTHLIPGARDHASGSLPQPRMGAEDAPPIEGGVYKGARDENQSPPPSPSPSPPPQSSSSTSQQQQQQQQQQHTARPGSSQTPARPSSVSQATPRTDVDVAMADASRAFGVGNNSNNNTTHANNTNQPPPPPPATPQAGSAAALLNSYQHGRSQTPRRDSGTPGPDSAIVSGGGQAHKLFPASVGSRSSAPQAAPNGQGPMVLFDNLNNAIDPSIREQFHTDDQGRVLFFDRPPLGKLNYSDVCDPDGKIPAHMRTSIKYRAQKLREKLRAKMVRPEEAVQEEEEAGEDANRVSAAAMDVDDANTLTGLTSARDKAHGGTTTATDGANRSSYDSNNTTTTTPKPAAPTGSSITSTLAQPQTNPPLWKTNPITLAETTSSRVTPSQIRALDPRRVLPSCEHWARQHHGTSYLDWCAAMHASNLYLYRDACNAHDHWREYMDESVGRAAKHWRGEFARAREQAERAREVEEGRRREEMRRRRDVFRPPRFYVDDVDPMHVGEWMGPDPWGEGHPLGRKEGDGKRAVQYQREQQQQQQQREQQREARGGSGSGVGEDAGAGAGTGAATGGNKS